jgi:hypothetical protein
MTTIKVKEGYTKIVAVVPNELNDKIRLKCKKQGDLSRIVVEALKQHLEAQPAC